MLFSRRWDTNYEFKCERICKYFVTNCTFLFQKKKKTKFNLYFDLTKENIRSHQHFSLQHWRNGPTKGPQLACANKMSLIWKIWRIVYHSISREARKSEIKRCWKIWSHSFDKLGKCSLHYLFPVSQAK